MLARLLRPIHRKLPILPLSVALAVLGGVWLPRTLWSDQPFQLGLVSAGLVALMGVTRPRFAITILGAMVVAGMACAAAGDLGHAPLIMELVALIALPPCLTVLTTPHAHLSAQACEPAVGLSGALAQLVVLCALPVGLAATLGCGLGAVLCLCAPGALPQRARDREASIDAAPAPLPALPSAPRLLRVLPPGLFLAAVLLAGFVHRLPYRHVGIGTWLVLGVLVAVWSVMTGDIVAAIFLVGFDLFAVVSCPVGPGGDHGMVLLGILAPAQVLPLTWWWQRFEMVPWRVAVVIGIVAPFVLLLGSSPSLAGVALAGVGGVAICALRPTKPRHGPLTPRAMLRAARGSLPIYWTMYLPLKLHLDPMFLQLGADPRPWRAVLDVGCGPGLGAAVAFTRPGGLSAYCGVDLDQEKLRVARVLLHGAGRDLTDDCQLVLGRMPFAQDLPRTYDTVLLLDVLHYWDPAEQQRLLSYLRRQTEPGGEMWLRDGVVDAEGSMGQVGAGERFTTSVAFNPGGGALYFQSAVCLEGWFEAAGWTVLERQPSGAQNRLWRLRASAVASA